MSEDISLSKGQRDAIAKRDNLKGLLDQVSKRSQETAKELSQLNKELGLPDTDDDIPF